MSFMIAAVSFMILMTHFKTYVLFNNYEINATVAAVAGHKFVKISSCSQDEETDKFLLLLTKSFDKYNIKPLCNVNVTVKHKYPIIYFLLQNFYVYFPL